MAVVGSGGGVLPVRHERSQCRDMKQVLLCLGPAAQCGPRPHSIPPQPTSFSLAGVAVVSAGGAIWPAGQRSMCGDSSTLAQPRPHEAGGVFWTGAVVPASVLTEGQVVNVTVRLTANHMGRFTFRVCRITGTDVAAEQAQLTDACLDEHILLQANTTDAQVGTALLAGSLAGALGLELKI